MILAVCLNPALQRTLAFGRVELGKVNRASSVAFSVGGKGANVARVASALGAPVRLLLPLGGPNGREVRRLLEAGRIRFTGVPVSGDTRLCQTLLDTESRTQTELVEESPPVSRAEVRAVAIAFETLLRSARVVALSGTAPRGFPETVYRDWVRKAGRRGIPCILDAPGRLALAGLEAKPWLYKPNWAEMEGVLGRSVTPKDAPLALAALAALGAENVVVTRDGPHASAFTGGGYFEIGAPELEPVNAIGSGDAVSAGMAAVRLKDGGFDEALRLGMACGAANVLTALAGHVRRADVLKIMPEILVRPMA